MFLKDLIKDVCRKNPNTYMSIFISNKTWRYTTAERLMHSELYVSGLKVVALRYNTKKELLVSCY